MDSDETWQVWLRPEITKLCTFPAKSLYGFRREREKWVAEAFFFVTWATHHFCHFPWIDFRHTFHEHVSKWWLATHGFIFQKFPLRDRISRKTVFFTVCAQPTGHGKRSATPRLFPSPGGHPTDVPYLDDFCGTVSPVNLLCSFFIFVVFVAESDFVNKHILRNYFYGLIRVRTTGGMLRMLQHHSWL